MTVTKKKSLKSGRQAEKADRAKEREEENKLSPKVAVMKPILRFLQLLCENHNREMQNLLRDQVSML
jgi:inositol 1,4,5-triphosphate receptor type 1